MHDVAAYILAGGGWALLALDVASARTSGRAKTAVDLTGWVVFWTLLAALAALVWEVL